ncbi:hypothetical protein GS882_03265 [Rhodococcus hoagii]|uniref:SGNH hydrolase-type esterase domain-containing protein n=1 Tax=Rhodococcus hoagii TaxID=43767 RepID=A0A9Q4ZIN0_RHOHA|nr:hypothetical protein [Prescottella equi]
MSYNKFHDDWKNDPDSSTPITAEAIEHIEDGVQRAHVAIDRASIGSLRVTNLEGLQRWADARGNALIRPVSISALGDSITWGVGSDDTANTTDEDVMRQRSWCVQLRKRLNLTWGAQDANGWMGLRPAFASGALTSGATASASIGPYGSFSGGGVSITPGGTVSWPTSSKLGAFTEIDVWYWGSDAAVTTPREPLVTIDGTARNSPTADSATGSLRKVTVTGLADTAHEVVLSTAGGTCYLFGVTVRRSPSGFVVNRVAKSGATTNDICGTQTGAARTRNIDAALLDSDLLILALGTNDQGSQVALDKYKANLQEVIDRQVARGGCVLLIGEPPRAVPTGEITENQYRDAMRSLAGGSNPHVAYTDWRDFFGDGAEAFHRGLFPTYNTVHPSAKGHGVIANAMYELLTLPSCRA